LVDLDADGNVDLLSGSWPGEIFLFRGGPGRTFAAPQMIQDAEGEYINIGGGIEEQPDGSLMITGNVTYTLTDGGGMLIEYHGKPISTTDRRVSSTGTASAVHAADWDADGDFDLLVGDIRGSVYFVPNSGSAKAYSFGAAQQLVASDEPVEVKGDAGPFVVDWDGDGDLDLLVGDGRGAVSLFTNVGTRAAPVLASSQELVPADETAYGTDAPKEARRGVRAKVCAADWNGDGRLDLFVGDYAKQAPNLPEPTPEEKARHDAIRAQLDQLQSRYSEIAIELYSGQKKLDDERRKELDREFQELGPRMSELRDQVPPEYESHGWVWLFLRAPAERTAQAR
jgi:hypothetical protein